uniref:cell wall protein DAN4-like n=1 Tax=Solea senegalensis TaxID=28829 RepID=UPI001CD82171|nr:cell wall protein DAN4-like [Solea senegalensis]
MKLLLSLTFIWALSSTAGALVCQTCTDDACTSTVPLSCDKETMCITAAIQAVSSGIPGQQIFKACASSSLCPVIGSQTFSVNLNISSAIASATCCNTDSCNSATLSFPTTPSVNNLECYSCDPFTLQCTNSIKCTGTEDRCFQASCESSSYIFYSLFNLQLTNGATTSPAFGCANVIMCAAAEKLGMLPFMKNVGNITSGPTCCKTDLCNSAAPTTTTIAPTTITAPTTTTSPTTTTTAPGTTTTTPSTTTAPPTTTTAPTTTITGPTTTTASTTTTTAPTTCPNYNYDFTNYNCTNYNYCTNHCNYRTKNNYCTNHNYCTNYCPNYNYCTNHYNICTN